MMILSQCNTIIFKTINAVKLSKIHHSIKVNQRLTHKIQQYRVQEFVQQEAEKSELQHQLKYKNLSPHQDKGK